MSAARPHDWKIGLVHRHVPGAAIARINGVDVLLVEAGIGATEVGDESSSMNRGGVRSGAVEGVEVVERGPAGPHHERDEAQLLLVRPRAPDRRSFRPAGQPEILA